MLSTVIAVVPHIPGNSKSVNFSKSSRLYCIWFIKTRDFHVHHLLALSCLNESYAGLASL